MKIINFNPNGEPLRISFKFIGLIVASYTYTLYEAGSNKKVERKCGNNQNPEDDIYFLPYPVINNNDRIIEFSVSFKGKIDPQSTNEFDKNYENIVEIFQGDNLIGSDSDKGAVTGKPQDTLIFLKLKS